MGQPVEVKPVSEVRHPDDLLRNCFPAFGAACIRRIYDILCRAIGEGVPLNIAVSGPITASNQHRAWLIPLLETGWVASLATTDAACYHDGHDSLEKFEGRPLREVQIEGHDEEYRDAGVIRITDIGFKEDILFNQDRFFTALFRQPEMQRKMSGTEFRNIVGKYYDAQERAFGVKSGLLATCWKHGIPVFVGAPGDGSAFLNSVKLWALKELGIIDHKFEIDIHQEVFESCAYHNWGLTTEPRKIGILILGGGVPKNFSLQPEPTLSQIFLLDGIQGYDFDVQIVGAPVSDGSLTGCKGQEAHTWGKVSREALRSTVESLQADYSTVMPLIVWALLDKRRRFRDMAIELGGPKLLSRHPEAAGFLRDKPYRLFNRRSELMDALKARLNTPEQIAKLMATFDFPLELAKVRG